MTCQTGHKLIEQPLSQLIPAITAGRLTLPGDVLARTHDAVHLATAVVQGKPIGVIVTDACAGTVIDGSYRLAALALAFRDPTDGGLSVDLASDTPRVVVGHQPGEMPLAVTLETMSYLRWTRAAGVTSSRAVLNRATELASHIAAYSVPVVRLPHGVDSVEARAAYGLRIAP